MVPNLYSGSATWDLRPTSYDPSQGHVEFIGLPAQACDIRIFTLAGDLVQTLHFDGGTGAGSLAWDLMSRNGQEVVSGVYLYTLTCEAETVVRRFTIMR